MSWWLFSVQRAHPFQQPQLFSRNINQSNPLKILPNLTALHFSPNQNWIVLLASFITVLYSTFLQRSSMWLDLDWENHVVFEITLTTWPSLLNTLLQLFLFSFVPKIPFWRICKIFHYNREHLFQICGFELSLASNEEPKNSSSYANIGVNGSCNYDRITSEEAGTTCTTMSLYTISKRLNKLLIEVLLCYWV